MEHPVKVSEIKVKPSFEIPKPEKPPIQVTELNIEVPKMTIPEIKPHLYQEVQVEIKYPQPEIIATPPKTEYQPIHTPIIEPIKEPQHRVSTTHEHQHVKPDEALNNLFDLHSHDDVAERFSHVTIDDIQSAMGLNERIFTLKELIGGDKTLFDATC